MGFGVWGLGFGVKAALDQNIWDMVYINTHPYAAGNPGTYGRGSGAQASGVAFTTFHRKYNIREGPNQDNEIPVYNLLDIDGNLNKAAANFDQGNNGPFGSYGPGASNIRTNPRERLYFVTHDYGKTMWWHEEQPGGSGLAAAPSASTNACHPFCKLCRYPFNYHWCSDANSATPLCAQKAPGASNSL